MRKTREMRPGKKYDVGILKPGADESGKMYISRTILLFLIQTMKSGLEQRNQLRILLLTGRCQMTSAAWSTMRPGSVLGRNKAGTLTLKVDARGLWGEAEIKSQRPGRGKPL